MEIISEIISSNDSSAIYNLSSIRKLNKKGYKIIAVTDVLLDRDSSGKRRREINIYMEKIVFDSFLQRIKRHLTELLRRNK